MPPARLAALLVLLAACPAWAGVVINEVMYHAPDDLYDVQFIELHNPGDKAADLSGWKVAGDVKYAFAPGTALAAGGYLVLCKDLKEHRRHYGTDAAAKFDGSLGRSKGTVELLDATGRRADMVRYRSRAPWPIAADGAGSSLERVCPLATGDDPSSWAPSPLPTGSPRPAGSPGKRNATWSESLPPVIGKVMFTPSSAGPDQEVKVEAEVRSATGVELRYRVAGSGFEKEEQTVVMKETAKGRFAAVIPPQKAGQIVRFRVRAVDAKKAERFHPHPNEVRPALSVYVHEKLRPGKVPFGLIVNVRALAGRFPRGFGAAPLPTPPVRGSSAYVHVDQKTGRVELFDFINVTPRTGGWKVRSHKDRPLGGLRTVNLIYEYNDRFVLAEPMAFEVHRRAGNAAPKTDFVRTWVDGRPVGFMLLIEQPNKSYLRRNELRTDGNLYKANWTGWTVIGRHEKKTNVRTGHDDLIKLLSDLSKTTGEKQWAVIKKEIDVEQVATHYAVRMLLSDWDGFFNNFFLYHDVHGTGKWTLHPWDQDKTWGFHDGVRGDEVWTEMPITFGMAGDRPPPLKPGEPNFGFGGPPWWRTGGDLSRPLLANATFRKLFLARLKELLETTYTEKVILPLIQALGERLEAEVEYRAGLHGVPAKQARAQLARHLEGLREHLKKRRAFLLAQDEVKKAGKFDRSLLK